MNKRQWKKYKKKRGVAFVESGTLRKILMEKLFPCFEGKTYIDKF